MGRITVGAVCVYHEMVAPAVAALAGTGIPVAAVSTGFPAGLSPFALRLAEIGESVAAGAAEIDIVISRRHVLTGDWQALYDEMRAFRAACGPAHVKAILATGELGHPAQRRPRQPGVHDGGGRFHQDLDRQGKRQRHPAGEPCDDPRDPRLPRPHRGPRRLQAGRAGFPGPRTRWSICR